MPNWIFLKELFICIKIDSALHSVERSIYHKTQTNKKTNKQANKNEIQNMYIQI